MFLHGEEADYGKIDTPMSSICPYCINNLMSDHLKYTKQFCLDEMVITCKDDTLSGYIQWERCWDYFDVLECGCSYVVHTYKALLLPIFKICY